MTDPSAIPIRNALQTLTDGDRLDASAIKNLPAGGGGGAIAHLGRASGSVTSPTIGLFTACSIVIPANTVQVGDELEIYGMAIPSGSNTGNTSARVEIGGTAIFRQGAGAGISEKLRRSLFVESATVTYVMPSLFGSAYSSEGHTTLNIDWSQTVTVDFMIDIEAANDSVSVPLARILRIRA